MAITKEEILELFRETDRRLQENARQFQETDRLIQENAQGFKELRQLFAKADQRLEENARQMKESDRRLEETDRLLEETARQMKETDRQMKETARQMKDTDRKVKEVTQAVGRLGNRLGQFVEEMVKPAVVRLFRERGIAVHHVYPRATATYEDDAMEIDLLVVNTTDAVLVEVKSELKQDDVKEHLDRLARFKKLFPDHRERRVMGALAAMVVSDETARYAYRQGLFVLGQSGDTLALRNDSQFAPRVW